MKMYWSSFLTLILLFCVASCGSEQFGTAPQTKSETTDALEVFKQGACSNHTRVKPAVDILYLVDNSSSTFYVPDQVKTAIASTIASISSDFDYHVIGAPLISEDTSDFQLLVKNPKSLTAFNNKKVTDPSQFNFFSKTNTAAGGNEYGLRRVDKFLEDHLDDGLFRQDSHLFVIIVSNGRDKEVETQISAQSFNTVMTPSSNPDPDNGINTVFDERLKNLLVKKSHFNSKQFRLFSVTAKTSCQSGWLSSENSYVAMSKALYDNHTPSLSDQTGTDKDHYNLCSTSNISTLFSSVNKTIKQIVVPHKYKYWPITSTNDDIDVSSIRVLKSTSASVPPAPMTQGWSYKLNPNYPGPFDIRIEPTVGESVTARHLIEFADGSEIVYPECVTVSLTSNVEYFKYIVIDRPAKVETIIVKINGEVVPTSDWSYIAFAKKDNIKVAHNGYPDTPPVPREGFMIELKKPENYYKSGDSVEVNYLPDSI